MAKNMFPFETAMSRKDDGDPTGAVQPKFDPGARPDTGSAWGKNLPESILPEARLQVWQAQLGDAFVDLNLQPLRTPHPAAGPARVAGLDLGLHGLGAAAGDGPIFTSSSTELPNGNTRTTTIFRDGSVKSVDQRPDGTVDSIWRQSADGVEVATAHDSSGTLQFRWTAVEVAGDRHVIIYDKAGRPTDTYVHRSDGTTEHHERDSSGSWSRVGGDAENSDRDDDRDTSDDGGTSDRDGETGETGDDDSGGSDETGDETGGSSEGETGESGETGGGSDGTEGGEQPETDPDSAGQPIEGGGVAGGATTAPEPMSGYRDANDPLSWNREHEDAGPDPVWEEDDLPISRLEELALWGFDPKSGQPSAGPAFGSTKAQSVVDPGRPPNDPDGEEEPPVGPPGGFGGDAFHFVPRAAGVDLPGAEASETLPIGDGGLPPPEGPPEDRPGPVPLGDVALADLWDDVLL